MGAIRSLITDEGVRALTSLTSLQSLDLGACTQISDEGVRALSSLTSLQNLNMGGCDQITDQGVRLLSSLTSLQGLDLGMCITKLPHLPHKNNCYSNNSLITQKYDTFSRQQAKFNVITPKNRKIQ